MYPMNATPRMFWSSFLVKGFCAQINIAKSKMGEDDFRNWNVELEVSLFHAMRRHKPVGVNKHFQMACIHNKLNECVTAKKITSKDVWTHLGEMYDLSALNESEILPFPNKETDFVLPSDSLFGDLQSKDYPRCPKRAATHQEEAKEVKESTRGKGGPRRHEERESREESTRGKSSHSAVASTPDNSPKRERKRTRQTANTHSPHPSGPEGPSTAKRMRRI